MKKHDKALARYMALPYTFELTPSGSGYVVSVKELPGCLSQGETIEEALNRVRGAMELWLTVCLEDGRTIPEPGDSDKYSGRFVVRIPKHIHRAVAEAAQEAGTSLNMYVATTLAQSVGAGR